MDNRAQLFKLALTFVILTSSMMSLAQDTLTIHFEGNFAANTRFLMIFRLDTVCIQVNAGEFSSFYNVQFPADIQSGDILCVRFWYISKVRRNRHIYKDTGIEVRYNGGREIWVSNEIFNTETYVVYGESEYLDYHW